MPSSWLAVVLSCQVAINWCRAKGAIPIVGVKNLQQAKDNLACLAWTLKPAEVRAEGGEVQASRGSL